MCVIHPSNRGYMGGVLVILTTEPLSIDNLGNDLLCINEGCLIDQKSRSDDEASVFTLHVMY